MKERPRLPWIYIGSHNCTRSAWGALQKQNTQFAINNYECGVVLLPKSYIDYLNGEEEREGEKEKKKDVGIQARSEEDLCEEVDLCFECPVLPYRDIDLPFCQS